MPKNFRRDIEELYLRQLRQLWGYTGRVADVRLRSNQELYRMLFASDFASLRHEIRLPAGPVPKAGALPD